MTEFLQQAATTICQPVFDMVVIGSADHGRALLVNPSVVEILNEFAKPNTRLACLETLLGTYQEAGGEIQEQLNNTIDLLMSYGLLVHE
ncbi:MAG TPA: hypothetical protein DEG43_11775 [Acidimicrobiaceae bacterium]|jgi:hypothetical protein|nr:hypothetical protein [Acidimicrobiaceae bacterium]